jgi:hypothetical protein
MHAVVDKVDQHEIRCRSPAPVEPSLREDNTVAELREGAAGGD